MTSPAPTHSGPGVVDALTKKIGPLPGYAYVLLVVVAVYVYRKRKPATPPAISDTGVVDSGAGTADGSSSGTGLSGASSGVAVGETNAQYGARLTSLLIGLGHSPSDVSNAVSTWLSGGKLTPAQEALINQGVTQTGPPPEGVLPFNLVPTTVTPVTTPPKVVSPAPKPKVVQPVPAPVTRTYTVTSGDTLWAIAQRYYGNGTQYTKIATANNIAPPYVIQPNQRLVIPA